MTRLLLLAGGVAAPLIAVVLAIIAGTIEPGYSQIEDHLSGLASVPSTTRWVMTPAFFSVGLGTLLLAWALGRTHAGVLMAVAGSSTILVGAFPRSCVEVACGDPAWHHRLHDGFSVPAYLALIFVPVLAATRSELGLSVRAAGLTAATTAVLAGVFALDAVPSWNGLIQRTFVVIPLAWLAGAAVKLALCAYIDGHGDERHPHRGDHRTAPGADPQRVRERR